MSPETVSGIIAALSETMDNPTFAVVGDFGRRPMWLSAYQLLFMLLGKPNSARDDNLHILFHGKSLGWLTEILRDEIFSHGLLGSKKDESKWLLSEGEFKEVLELMFGRYRAARPDELLSTPGFLNILYAWLQGGKPDEACEWVKKQIATNAGLLLFLSQTRSWISVNGVPHYPLKRRDLQPFLNFDEVIERLKGIVRDESADPQERDLADELFGLQKKERNMRFETIRLST